MRYRCSGGCTTPAEHSDADADRSTQPNAHDTGSDSNHRRSNAHNPIVESDNYRLIAHGDHAAQHAHNPAVEPDDRRPNGHGDHAAEPDAVNCPALTHGARPTTPNADYAGSDSDHGTAITYRRPQSHCRTSSSDTNQPE
ncbi:MAG: hypothetical protein NVS4B8_23900 [Herpetosiphon sp.]